MNTKMQNAIAAVIAVMLTASAAHAHDMVAAVEAYRSQLAAASAELHDIKCDPGRDVLATCDLSYAARSAAEVLAMVSPGVNNAEAGRGFGTALEVVSITLDDPEKLREAFDGLKGDKAAENRLGAVLAEVSHATARFIRSAHGRGTGM
ncbi:MULTISPECIES: hypothetical protein [Enterobacteriaceae]|uniref:hypothetical protein n=1 Tax=Enterobacteriaceae TaxID=543 RepID=UPI00226B6383|nr:MULTISPECIES: hypothetical protein [Enterobacteriaceae]MDA8491014.1 hypothetical protein [Kluyvera sp. Awk 3]